MDYIINPVAQWESNEGIPGMHHSERDDTMLGVTGDRGSYKELRHRKVICGHLP